MTIHPPGPPRPAAGLPHPLARAAHGRRLGGVCAGLAKNRALPVGRLRAAFAVAALVAGLGILVYVACWLIIPAEGEELTTAAAARGIVAEVEDERAITVEMTAIGDRRIDPAGEALVAAAREALRNAARHAGGAPVVVFAELEPAGVEVFARDDGAGFDPDRVPAERRGIRDAIVGRMAATSRCSRR